MSAKQDVEESIYQKTEQVLRVSSDEPMNLCMHLGPANEPSTPQSSSNAADVESMVSL